MMIKVGEGSIVFFSRAKYKLHEWRLRNLCHHSVHDKGAFLAFDQQPVVQLFGFHVAS